MGCHLPSIMVRTEVFGVLLLHKAAYDQKRKLAHRTKVIEVTPDTLKDIIIPLPHRDKQDMVVEQLDRFDGLCNDIEEGILAEIETRQKAI